MEIFQYPQFSHRSKTVHLLRGFGHFIWRRASALFTLATLVEPLQPVTY
jgi:hypothetical protein